MRYDLVLSSVAKTSTHKTNMAYYLFNLTDSNFVLRALVEGNDRGILVSRLDRLTFDKFDHSQKSFFTFIKMLKEEHCTTNKPLQGAGG